MIPEFSVDLNMLRGDDIHVHPDYALCYDPDRPVEPGDLVSTVDEDGARRLAVVLNRVGERGWLNLRIDWKTWTNAVTGWECPHARVTSSPLVEWLDLKPGCGCRMTRVLDSTLTTV